MTSRFPFARRSARWLALAALIAGGTAVLAYPALDGPPAAKLRTAAAPVVVELFTSQGCSSCPPADNLATRLARDPGVLVISRPVTYWDRLGWKDTLASPANTELQRAYARRGFDGNGVYTPQIVVDGRSGAVGSDERRVRALVGQAAKVAKPRLALAATAKETSVLIEGSNGSGELVLLALRPRVTGGIGSGENGGRRVTYTNVLQRERVLGTWNGGKARFAIPRDALSAGPNTTYASVLRESAGGPILAARAIGVGSNET